MSLDTAFAGLIPDEIDLSQYMQPDESVSVRPAHYFTEKTIGFLDGREKKIGGLPLPWAKAADDFAFRPGEMTIWTGYKAHGKSMMLSQIMLGAMCAGERVLIISPEFRPEGILARKIRQAACTGKPAEGFARQFLSWAGDERLWLFDHQGSLKPEMVTAVIRFAIEQHGVSHVVVDSLMKCGIGTDDYNLQKKFVDDLQSIAHQSDVHIHLVAHARKSDNDEKPARLHDVKGTSELCDMAENVLSVWKNKKKLDAQSRGDHRFDDVPDAILCVDSQRNGDGWTGMISLWYHQRAFQFVEGKGFPPFEYSFDSYRSSPPQ